MWGKLFGNIWGKKMGKIIFEALIEKFSIFLGFKNLNFQVFVSMVFIWHEILLINIILST